jgi:hypothetical protein
VTLNLHEMRVGGELEFAPKRLNASWESVPVSVDDGHVDS